MIASGLDVLFCGINPSLLSAGRGHHFARPGNRFWPTLHAAGSTPRPLDPSEEQELLPLGLGITNVVARATAAADELTGREIVAQYAQHHLGDQLFADGDFAPACKPELHGGNIIPRSLPRPVEFLCSRLSGYRDTIRTRL